MASLKEIRSRINSVTNTRKITGAMKMVSSAKLHRAQEWVVHFNPYYSRIKGILDAYIESGGDTRDTVLLSKQREIKRVAIVAFSSNSSLCGSFNSNVQKKLKEVLSDKYASIPKKNISLYLIGKKVYEDITKVFAEYEIKGPFFDLAHKPDRGAMDDICNELTKLFLLKEIDKVEIIYNRFKNTVSQAITCETLLPVVSENSANNSTNNGVNDRRKRGINYIVEPNAEQFLDAIVPEILHLQMYGAMLNSYASEHGARTTAMQFATDNADELIESLVLEYNKLRQDAITKEIIDIIGGSEVQR